MKNWPVAVTGQDWVHQTEKRISHEERRPLVRRAADLLGPGLGPRCIRIVDWNADETAFNGFFYSEPGSLNSPDTDVYWMGQVICNDDGFGIQQVWEYRYADPDTNVSPIQHYIRRSYNVGTGTRQFSPWVVA
jgi:hypothetical protein